MAWDDDKKARAIELYKEREPTPENSMEIVKEIADELEESPNGVRRILSLAEVYVKKEATAAKKSTSAAKTGGATRVSKEDAHARLTAAIEGVGGTVDGEIISKLTGKAAIYLAEVIEASNSNNS